MKKLGYGIKKFVETPFFLQLKPTLNNVQRGACIKALLPSDKNARFSFQLPCIIKSRIWY